MTTDGPLVASEPYPLEVWKLAKGQTLTPEECERTFHVQRAAHQAYDLALLRLKSFIERAWRDERGEVVTVRRRGDGLHICTDTEAVGANERLLDQSTRAIRKIGKQVVGIDRSQLPPKALAPHEALLVRSGTLRALLAGGTRKQQARLRASKRGTPGLLESHK